MDDAVKEFVKEFGFALCHYIPYFAKVNGQAEASNKILKEILEKMIDDNHRNWHNILFETLWAYRTFKISDIGIMVMM